MQVTCRARVSCWVLWQPLVGESQPLVPAQLAHAVPFANLPRMFRKMTNAGMPRVWRGQSLAVEHCQLYRDPLGLLWRRLVILTGFGLPGLYGVRVQTALFARLDSGNSLSSASLNGVHESFFTWRVFF